MRKTLLAFLAPLALLEWGGVLLYFHLSGRINAFLHPSFRPQVLIAGVLLLLSAVVLLLTRHQKIVCECGPVENCPDPDRSPVQMSWLFPLMLLVPLGIAATFTRDTFGSKILITRGVAESAAELPGLTDKYAKMLPIPVPQNVEPALPGSQPSSEPATSDESTLAEYFKPNAEGAIELNVADLLYAAEEPTLREPFVGKSAELTGQFMPAKTNNPAGTRFKLVRLFMNCCAADAQPVSLMVEFSEPLPATVTEMAWIKVVGEVTFPVENGRTIAVLRAKKVVAVDPPEETMLY